MWRVGFAAALASCLTRTASVGAYDSAHPQPTSTGTPPPIKMLLCTMIRNESNYLLEWIEFHKMQGFDHFRIWDNTRKEDKSPTIEETLLKYYPNLEDAGISLIYPFKFGQGKAFEDCSA